MREGLCDAVSHVRGPTTLEPSCFPAAYFRTSCCWTISRPSLADEHFEIWTNHAVPPNDGGISLGQAALAAFGRLTVTIESELCMNSRSR